MTDPIELVDVTAANWRDAADLEVAEHQCAFVAPVSRYLCLCHYGGLWRPLAIVSGGAVVGFVMWAVDPDDHSGWIGGLVIGRQHQRRGYGRAGQPRRPRALRVARLHRDRRARGRRARGAAPLRRGLTAPRAAPGSAPPRPTAPTPRRFPRSGVSGILSVRVRT